MRDEIEESPNPLVIERKSNKSIDEDASAIEFSRKDVLVKSIKNSVAKVARERKRGNELSKTILMEMIPSALE
jgi:hypothetical protein